MTISTPENMALQAAIRDFQRARRAARMQRLMARVTGKNANLLCYDDVRRQLREASPPLKRGLQEIPLDKIVGSVGRYKDFTRDFMPRRDSDEQRWAAVKTIVEDMRGMKPIEVYQLGDAYFVLDGNHRVSVARQLQVDTISAYVTEIKTRVPFSADDSPDKIICKARLADFLEKTNLDKLRPDSNLEMTFCGQFPVILSQIEAEQQLLARSRPNIPEEALWSQAVEQWYDHVYMPVISIVRELGILYTFPELTEADVYLLLSERRDDLETALGWHIDLPEAVPELVEETRKRQRPVLARLVGAVAPELDEGPPPGEWRREQMAMHRENHLFADILLIMEGIGQDWDMLERAIEVAVWDEDRILGLRVANERRLTPEGVAETRDRFLERCRETGIEAEFAYEEGNPLKIILRRAAWADLMLINLTHPPDSTPLDRLRNIWGPLIQRSPCPILAFPHAVRSTMVNALLPYDGSPQSREALFVATYLAARWQIGLTVVTVTSRYTEAAALEEARKYLTEHGIDWARFVLESGEIGDSILRVADEVESDLLIMGSYGRQPLKRLVLGSAVEQMLREFPHPMLICR